MVDMQVFNILFQTINILMMSGFIQPVKINGFKLKSHKESADQSPDRILAFFIVKADKPS